MIKIKPVMFVVRASKDLRWHLGNQYACSELRKRCNLFLANVYACHLALCAVIRKALPRPL